MSKPEPRHENEPRKRRSKRRRAPSSGEGPALPTRIAEPERVGDDTYELLDSIGVAILFLDRDLRIERFNPTATTLFELTEEHLGRSIGEVARRFEDGALAGDLRAVLEGAERRRARVRHEDDRWFVRHALAHRSGPDGVGGIVLTFTEVSELVKLTGEVQRRSRQHATVARLGQVALASPTPEAFFREAVEAIADTLDVDLAKVMQLEEDGQRLRLVAGVGLEAGLVGEHTISTGRSSQAGYTLLVSRPVVVADMQQETRFQSKLLAERGVRSGMSVIIEGPNAPYGVLGAYTRSVRDFDHDDVTFLQSVANLFAFALARFAAEVSLRRSEERMRTAINAAKLVLYHTDHELRYTWVSGSHPAFSGEAFLGRTDGEIEDLEGARTLTEAKHRVLETGAVESAEFGLRTLAGTHVWNVSLHPRHDPSGEVVGLMGVAVDVTELKAKEMELEELNRRKDEFLAILAHELRNPLAALDGTLRVLDGSADPNVEELREIALDETRKLARLVDDLVDARRLESGEFSLRSSRVEVADVVERAVAEVRDLFEEREHELVTTIRPRTLALRADPDRLQQIVANLLSNAAKYTTRGGSVRLTARHVRKTDEVRIDVVDDGVGLAPGSTEAIFEPFTQIRREGAARSGFGIGLTLIRQLVLLHDGRIDVASEGVGRGSTFTVHLPRALSGEDASPGKPRSRPAKAPPSAPMDILVVDDNRASAVALKKLLQRSGNRVQVAHTGADAIAASDRRPPRVALVDLDLPDMSGLAVARGLRRHPAGTVIVATTGFGDAATRRKLKRAGFAEHFVKPIDFHALERVLYEVARNGSSDERGSAQ